MQLKIQRSQRAGGITGGTVLFCLDVRADYSPEERENISKYKLGGQVIYSSQAARKHAENANAHLDRVDDPRLGQKLIGLGRGMASAALAKMSLNISIDSLGRGHHVECKDLEELLEAEDTVRTSCKNVTRYLDVAATFNGSETMIEYVKGEEIVHITPSAPPLLTHAAPESSPTSTIDGDAALPDPAYELGESMQKFWSNPQYRKLVYYGGAILIIFLLVRSCV
jgi:hypothetical protein